MRIAKKIMKWGTIGFVTLLVGLTLTVLALERRTIEAPYPDIHATLDPLVVARGRYLVYGPAHCVECHSDRAQRDGAAAGRSPELSGGFEFHLPIGTIRSANITSDPATGIGAMRDDEIARSLRYGVDRHGRALMPFMPFADLSDEDLRAIVSFLRTLPPAHKPVRARQLNPLGHAVVALLIKPTGPSRPIVRSVPAAVTADYGHYLVHNVANCAGCHTQRSMTTGAFTGPALAGGTAIPSDQRPDVKFVPPNLTPDTKTGRIVYWTEDFFVARFRTGQGVEGSVMPWAPFGRMTENDLRAIYRYLRSLPAVENETGESVRTKSAAPVARE